MINSKQKKYLKNLSNTLKPIFQLGKEGISENFLFGLNEALETHELVKISVLSNNKEDIKIQSKQIIEGTNSELIQVIGRKITIYRPSKNKIIDISKV